MTMSLESWMHSFFAVAVLLSVGWAWWSSRLTPQEMDELKRLDARLAEMKRMSRT